MASPRRAGEGGSGDGADAVQPVGQGLARQQDALRLQERKVFAQQEQEAEHKAHETLRLRQEGRQRGMQEALRLQEQRAERALQDVRQLEHELQSAIGAPRQPSQETRERDGGGRENVHIGGIWRGRALHHLEDRMQKLEASFLRAMETFLPRVDVLLAQEEPRPCASASPARARTAPAPGEEEGPPRGAPRAPSPAPAPASTSGAGHQRPAALE